MNLPRALGAACAGITLSMSAVAAPIDLNTWSQQGRASNGTWNVAGDGSSVLQTINGDPTFFVSPDEYLNTRFDGSFGVQQGGDNDYMGFVFGYQGPIAANGDGVTDFDFYLFDWKQGNQGQAREGFNLSRIDGTVEDGGGSPAFWDHELNGGNDEANWETLLTDHDTSKGWADNTDYDFSLIYQDALIQILINDVEIFNLTAADAGVAAFQSGRFGFYNYSQPNVRYQGFTQVVAPPPDPCIANPQLPGCVILPPPPVGVPEPGSLGLLLFGGAFALFRQRRRILG